MKLDNRYEIRIVVVTVTLGNFGSYLFGDVYNDFSLFKKEKPNSRYMFGFVVFDTESESVPDACNNWNASIQEAIEDCFANVVNNH